MYEFWYDYIKPKYQNNAKLCYVDNDSFIININVIGLMKNELGGKIITEFVAL